MRAIEPGDRVVVRCADDQRVVRRALTGVVDGDDFPVVWVCREEAWSGRDTQHIENMGLPWPAEDVALAQDRQ
jgi:hypothetical protein